jgi:hypothetical protein
MKQRLLTATGIGLSGAIVTLIPLGVLPWYLFAILVVTAAIGLAALAVRANRDRRQL